MTSSTPQNPVPRSLRSLDLLLRIALFLGAVVGVFLIVIASIVLVSDSGDVTLDAKSSALLTERAQSERPAPDEVTYQARRVEITVDVDDPVDEVIVLVGTGVLYALGYFALWSVWLVVDDAKASDPFARSNVDRLRRAGRAIVAFPIGFAALEFVMQERVNGWGAPFDIDVEVGPSDFWAVLGAGLALLVIAHVFERGVELRELDEATI